MIKNVYGTVTLEISRTTEAANKELAILESYYAISDDRVNLSDLTLHHKNGRKLGTVEVHNVNISWDKFLKREY
ncbi:hypothetical protein ABEV78_12610 [Bacillus licheniformis]|uniref:hypothetical protein n=1 Tax=Bacillus TaxID=1386 RepID=UPI0009B7960F|nr:hypothetical protein [Bacillus licheniformis]ARC67803.1 hypothetical protein B34_00360 [Bacillus licheniformis]MDE1421308.1 hypothetical protein [Bacillus licheniformis]